MFRIVNETSPAAKGSFKFDGRYFIFLSPQQYNGLSSLLPDIKDQWHSTAPHAMAAQLSLLDPTSSGVPAIVNVWEMDKGGQWISLADSAKPKK